MGQARNYDSKRASWRVCFHACTTSTFMSIHNKGRTQGKEHYIREMNTISVR